MVTKAERDRKNANAEFRNLMDSQRTHVRVGQGRGEDGRVVLLMTAAQAHGLDGVCTCCPRRPAGELSDRQRSAVEARAAARRAADTGPTPAPVGPSVAVELPDVEPTPKAVAIAAARDAARHSAELLSRRD